MWAQRFFCEREKLSSARLAALDVVLPRSGGIASGPLRIATPSITLASISVSVEGTTCKPSHSWCVCWQCYLLGCLLLGFLNCCEKHFLNMLTQTMRKKQKRPHKHPLCEPKEEPVLCAARRHGARGDQGPLAELLVPPRRGATLIPGVTPLEPHVLSLSVELLRHLRQD